MERKERRTNDELERDRIIGSEFIIDATPSKQEFYGWYMDKFNSGIDTARKEYKFCLSKANELLKNEMEDRKVQRIANLERQILKIEKDQSIPTKDRYALILSYEKQLSELEGHRVQKQEINLDNNITIQLDE